MASPVLMAASATTTPTTTSPTTTTASPPAKERKAAKAQACDACRLRKVRCNGAARCQQCSHLNLRCVYSAPQARARSSTKRGALISRYKAESRGNLAGDVGSSGARPPSHARPPSSSGAASGGTASPFSEHDLASAEGAGGSPHAFRRLPSLVDVVPLDSPPSSHFAAGSPGVLFDVGYFLSFLPDYEKCVYPVNPIVSPEEAREAILEMGSSREARAFAYMLVAITIILTPEATDLDRPTLACVLYWTDQVVAAKEPLRASTEVTARMIMTCEFLHVAYMGLQKHDLAFFYLREAITLATVARMDSPTVLAALPLAERARRQRLLWELWVHERYWAISTYRSCILIAPRDPPERDPNIPSHVHDGFLQIIQLFRVLDTAFIQNWLSVAATGSAPAVTAEWIESKHRQIDEEPAGSDASVAALPVMQQADLILTKHWLRTLVWQMALANCVLDGGGAGSGMSLTFPLGLSSSLRTLITRMSRRDIEVHGSGMQEKFFEITDTIASVMLALPALSAAPRWVENIEDFVFLAKFGFSLPTFGIVQRQILNEKLAKLRRRLAAVGGEPDDAGGGDMLVFSQWLDQTTLDEQGSLGQWGS